MHKLGLEAEFIFLKPDGSATTRKDILGVWKYFIERGWKEKRDPYNNELLGVKKETTYGPLVMDNDGSAILLEVAWPPYPDLAILRREVRSLIRQFNTCFGKRYRLIGYGCAPFTTPGAVPLTPKGHYPTLFEIIRGERSLDYVYLCGALQMNIGGTLPELLRACNIFAALTGPLFALGANTSIYGDKIVKARDIRGVMYDELQKHFKKGYETTVGIPARPFRSWKDYFFDLFSRPGHLLTIDGKIVEVLDSAPLFDILTQRKPIQIRDLPRSYFTSREEKRQYLQNRTRTVVLSVNDIELTQAICWRDNRLKFSFKPHTNTDEFIHALRSSANVFEKFLEENFSNAYIEIRPVSLQQPAEFLALPALTFGLMHDLESVEKIVKKHPWSFWQALRVAGYKDGMKAVVGGTSVSEIVAPLYDIAFDALSARGKREEKLLLPLRLSLDQQESPADRAEQLFKTNGKKTFLDTLTFTPEKI